MVSFPTANSSYGAILRRDNNETCAMPSATTGTST
jgi:hypothetical protein